MSDVRVRVPVTTRQAALALGAMALVSLGLLPSTAHAQAASGAATTRYSFEHFEPLHAQGTNILNVHGSPVAPHLRGAVSLFFHYEDDPMLVVRNGKRDSVFTRLVHSQLKAELLGSFGLGGFFELGVGLPLVLMQDGDDLAFIGKPGESVGGFALGDLRLTPKVRILDHERFGGFGLAIAAPLYLPTGDDATFNSDGRFRANPQLIIDWRHKSGFALSANIGWMFRPTREIHNAVFGDQLTWAVGTHIPLGSDLLALAASIHGRADREDNRLSSNLNVVRDDSNDTTAELDAALQLQPVRNITVSVGGGAGLTGVAGSPDYRLFLGVGWAAETQDRDHDGVADSDDACPDTPEDRDGFEDGDGCPDPDNDADDVLDAADECPNSPEDKDGYQDEDGCPDLDNDGDGVPDADDRCPDDAEDLDGFEDQDGCPDPDNDGDGVLDGDDRCPTQAEDRDGYEDEDGCPDPDNDGDGVLDVDDLCPTQPENKNGIDDEDGCPDSADQKVKMSAKKILILEMVHFDTAKATIKKRSHKLLAEVATMLQGNPQITLVRVEGHTDDRGNDDYNMQLSRDRAAAVKTFLVEQGVDATRLVTEGYGETAPVASNRSSSGRAKNRRVEFVILEVNGKPVEGTR
ncbi:MAG: OmpA family protein [Deltaproteobacteria bacterium]|nr:OmpA family protein [Deltaproteobacteria bacterium]MCB9787552.1 OmpA family protein [Deltaproteobacteria bacterium]